MNKLIDLWNRLIRSPRSLFTVLAVLGIILAGYWMFSSAFGPELTSLADGPLAPSQLSRASECLTEWGSTYRIRGSQILVESAHRDDLAARMDFLAKPESHVATSRRTPKASSIFVTESERQYQWKLSREESLAAQIQEFKGLRAARVFLAGVAKSGFGRDSLDPSASVIVWTQDEQPLGLSLAQAIRRTIAGTVAGLTCENVHVIDAATGCYVPVMAEGSQAGVTDGQAGFAPAGFADLNRRAQQLESRLQQKILDTFGYIPDLLVCVTVRPESLLADYDESAPGVSASVSIPRSHLLAMLPDNGAPGNTAFEPLAAEQIDRIAQAVRTIIGRPSSSLVNVDWYYDASPVAPGLLGRDDSEASAGLTWWQPAYLGGAIAMISLLVLLGVFVRRLTESNRRQRSIALSRVESDRNYLNYTPPAELPEETLSYRGPAGIEVSAFEGLARLDDATLRGLLIRAEPQIVALALRTTSDKLRRRILSALSAERRQAVHDHPDFSAPARLSDIEAAQQEMVDLLETPALEESDALVGSAEVSAT